MTRADDGLLDVERAVAEGRLCLGGRRAVGRIEVVGGLDEAHAAPAASRRGLEQHRKAHLGSHLPRLVEVDGPVRARDEGHARLGHGLFGRDLVAHRLDGLRPRPDEDEVVVLTREREGSILGEEAPARMDGVALGRGCGGDEGRDAQIAVGRERRPDVNRALGEADVEALAVGGRVHGDGLDAELATGADDADRDLAAVGDQDPLEHEPSRLELGSFRAPRGRLSAIRSKRREARGGPGGSSARKDTRGRRADGRSAARARRGAARTRPPGRSRRTRCARPPRRPP